MNKKRPLFVQNETGRLKSVLLGIGQDQGKQLDINPVAKYHIKKGTYPTEQATVRELKGIEEILLAEGIEVLRPENLKQTEQIFTRDIGFVIDEQFIIANMKESARRPEIKGINTLLEEIGEEHIIKLPNEAIIEGGDVLLYNEHVFVGIGKRTNEAGYNYLKECFPKKEFHAFELTVSDDPKRNILHLDCTFQPVGSNGAVIYEKGFKNRPNILYDLFEEENLIKITQEEMNSMFPNIFSLSPQKVIIEERFERLNKVLKQKGISCLTVPYREIAKLSGLLRCSTLPLYREKE